MGLEYRGQMLAAPGQERPDYTNISYPAASVVDAATEEIEIDQALSLQGRFGRDLLGVIQGHFLGDLRTEHLTISTADHEMFFETSLASRTGQFFLNDPELMWYEGIGQSITAPTTATSQGMALDLEGLILGEPFLYVAPRLFWRFANNIDATVGADSLRARIGSVSRRLTFRLFIELLERFADVTLL